MAAILRISGVQFDPDGFCARSALEPCAVWRIGEPRLPQSQPNGAKHDTNGMNIVCSDAGFEDFQRQIDETILFLRRYRDDLAKLSRSLAVEILTLDFGIQARDVTYSATIFRRSSFELRGNSALALSYPIIRSVKLTAATPKQRQTDSRQSNGLQPLHHAGKILVRDRACADLKGRVGDDCCR
jgi:hypothetical protein